MTPRSELIVVYPYAADFVSWSATTWLLTHSAADATQTTSDTAAAAKLSRRSRIRNTSPAAAAPPVGSAVAGSMTHHRDGGSSGHITGQRPAAGRRAPHAASVAA